MATLSNIFNLFVKPMLIFIFVLIFLLIFFTKPISLSYCNKELQADSFNVSVCYQDQKCSHIQLNFDNLTYFINRSDLLAIVDMVSNCIMTKNCFNNFTENVHINLNNIIYFHPNKVYTDSQFFLSPSSTKDVFIPISMKQLEVLRRAIYYCFA